MAAEVAWSQEAIDDLDAIAGYIGRDSPLHAQRIIEEFFALADSLSENPSIGRVVPEWSQPALRERFLYSYRLIYEIGVRIDVIAVIHGRRLLDAIDERMDRS